MCKGCNDAEKAYAKLIGDHTTATIFTVSTDDPMYDKLKNMNIDDHADFAEFTYGEWIIVWNTLFLKDDNEEKAANSNCPLITYTREMLIRNNFRSQDDMARTMCETLLHVAFQHNITF